MPAIFSLMRHAHASDADTRFAIRRFMITRHAYAARVDAFERSAPRAASAARRCYLR